MELGRTLSTEGERQRSLVDVRELHFCLTKGFCLFGSGMEVRSQLLLERNIVKWQRWAERSMGNCAHYKQGQEQHGEGWGLVSGISFFLTLVPERFLATAVAPVWIREQGESMVMVCLFTITHVHMHFQVTARALSSEACKQKLHENLSTGWKVGLWNLMDGVPSKII